MSEHEPELATIVLTCRTPDCGNEGVAITMDAPVDVSGGVCGVCGNEIPVVRAE